VPHQPLALVVQLPRLGRHLVVLLLQLVQETQGLVHLGTASQGCAQRRAELAAASLPEFQLCEGTDDTHDQFLDKTSTQRIPLCSHGGNTEPITSYCQCRSTRQRNVGCDPSSAGCCSAFGQVWYRYYVPIGQCLTQHAPCPVSADSPRGAPPASPRSAGTSPPFRCSARPPALRATCILYNWG